MPQPQLERFDQRTLLLALAGVTIDHAVHGFRILDGESSVEADTIQRNIDTPYMGAKPTKRTNFRANIAGTLELLPPAVPGEAVTGVPATDIALRICGLARALSAALGLTRYNVISSGFEAGDAHWYHAGLFIESANLRGDLSQIRMEIGQAFTARLAAQGNYDEIDQAALPTDVVMTAFGDPTIAEPENTELVISTTQTPTPDIDELHLRGKSLIANLGHTTAMKRYTEFRESGITARAATATIVFARPDFDEFNPDEYFRSGEIIVASFKLREPDGRYSLLRVRVEVGGWRPQNVDGDMCIEVTGNCIPSAPTGNDEVEIEFGDDTFRILGSWPDAPEDIVYVPGTGISVAGVYTGAVTYAVTDGALPAGLSLSAGGVLSGTPTDAGEATFEVTATDSTPGTPKTATKEFTIEITA